MKYDILKLIPVLALVFLTGCASWKSPVSKIDETPAVFPDYKDVTVPCNIAPLNFMVEDAGHIQATLTLDGGEALNVTGKDGIIRIPERKWHDMLSVAKGKSITVAVSVWSEEYPEGVAYEPFNIHVAAEEIDPWIS